MKRTSPSFKTAASSARSHDGLGCGRPSRRRTIACPEDTAKMVSAEDPPYMDLVRDIKLSQGEIFIYRGGPDGPLFGFMPPSN
jgi:hypothetical protein